MCTHGITLHRKTWYTLSTAYRPSLYPNLTEWACCGFWTPIQKNAWNNMCLWSMHNLNSSLTRNSSKHRPHRWFSGDCSSWLVGLESVSPCRLPQCIARSILQQSMFIILFFFCFLSQQFITQGTMAVHAYEELCMEYQYPNLFLCSYPTQRTTKELNP